MGGLDWSFSTITMWLANVVCIAMLVALKPVGLQSLWLGACVRVGVACEVSPQVPMVSFFASPWYHTQPTNETALSVFMAIQWVSGAIRFLSGTGVWATLRDGGKRD